MENAKLFVDFMSSEYGQSLMGTEVTGANAVRPGVKLADYKQDITKVKTIKITSQWSSEAKKKLLNDILIYILLFLNNQDLESLPMGNKERMGVQFLILNKENNDECSYKYRTCCKTFRR